MEPDRQYQENHGRTLVNKAFTQKCLKISAVCPLNARQLFILVELAYLLVVSENVV